jgi:hypothetical protein
MMGVSSRSGAAAWPAGSFSRTEGYAHHFLSTTFSNIPALEDRMDNDWHIDKAYTATGIHWRISLANTDLSWESDTPWGDEDEIISRLIREHAASVLGTIGGEDIRIDHVCGGKTGGTESRERWEHLPTGAFVWSDGGDRESAIRALWGCDSHTIDWKISSHAVEVFA